MSPLRSTTRTPSSSSIARACEGELVVDHNEIALVVRYDLLYFLQFARAELRGSGDWRVCKTMATVSAPAVSTSAASSSIEISVERSSASMLDAESPREHRPFSFLRQVLNG